MKKLSFLIVLLLIACLICENALAVNVFFTTKDVNFVPNQRLEIEYAAQNGNNEDMGISVFFTGDLAQYMSAEPANFPLGAGKTKKFTVIINFPEKIEKPGTHSETISIKEDRYNQKGTIVVFAQVNQPLRIHVPYSGKYLDASLSTDGAKQNQPITFKVSVANLGDETINSVYGTVYAYNSDNVTIGSASTDSASNLESNTQQELSTLMSSTGIMPGRYWADADMYYDGATKRTDRIEFRIGELKAQITNYTQQGYFGKINRFNVEAESSWNDPINNVYADVTLKNDTQVLNSFRTLADTLSPWEKKNLGGYIELSNVPIGNYTVEITLNYAGKTDFVSGNFEAVEEPKPEPEKPKVFPGSAIATIVGMTLLLINIIIWIMISKKKRDSNAK